MQAMCWPPYFQKSPLIGLSSPPLRPFYNLPFPIAIHPLIIECSDPKQTASYPRTVWLRIRKNEAAFARLSRAALTIAARNAANSLTEPFSANILQSQKEFGKTYKNLEPPEGVGIHANSWPSRFRIEPESRPWVINDQVLEV